MLTIADIQVEASPYPMRRAFASSKRSNTTAQNVRVTATLSDGTRGYGEGSPAQYVTGETPESVLQDGTEAGAALLTLPVRRWRTWSGALNEALPGSPTARSAVEMALLDALTRSLGVPLWHWFGGAADSVVTDLSLSLSDAAQAGETARDAAAAGFTRLKIKVGGPDLEADRERVLAVAAAAPAAWLRLDANQGFDAAGALAFVRDLQERGVRVELMEQPVPKEDWHALAAVTRECPVPVIADEAVVHPSDAVRIAREGAAHGVNIKLAKSGLLGALEIIAVARAAGLRLMLGCMLESLLGIGAGVHLACGTGAFAYLDLDAHLLIGLEATGLPFRQEGERQAVSATAAGIGWDPAASGA